MQENVHSHGDVEMTFLDHLEALRWHLIRSIAAIGVFAVLAFVNKSFIFDSIILAPKNIDFWTYRILCQLSHTFNLGDSFCMQEISFEVFNLSMAGQFTMHIMVSFAMGFIVAFPYFIWEMWRFFKPALTQKERNYATGLVFYSSLLFILGVLFGYFFLTPVSLQFLGNYQVSAEVANQINLESYISTMTMIVFAAAIIFEMPIAVYFLTKIGFLTPAIMRVYRKHALVAVLIVSAIITPPDITSQILLSIPFYILYEISINVSKAVLSKEAIDENFE